MLLFVVVVWLLFGDHILVVLHLYFSMERMFVHVSLMSASSPCLHVLMCRNVAKQAFLETLQDYPIEMDILGPARREAAPYNDGYVAWRSLSRAPSGCVTAAITVGS